ncbi:WbqC family protein [Deminuibacter soli]|uniref:WbqC family protein n=1 Tax=Deminuibacter soli TaxID=2291815 RepID=A0A3E1NJL7_9BACT|nr:WbqC family protein [Deminuibacter soli]RFM28127.1 hypothetical protein DXN05_11405 [Deminuibacter soli]
METKSHLNHTLLTDYQFFPCIAWCSALFRFSHIEIEQYENYPKSSFRNRCVIAGSNGVVNLSVPVVNGRDQKTLFREVRISDTGNWQLQHWRTVTSCYGKAPFFEYYAGYLEALLFTRRHTHLIDLNRDILQWLQKVLKVTAGISETTQFELQTTREGVADYRNHWLPKNQGDYTTPHYYQLFEDRIGFQHNLSILDLLFCEGPNAGQVLMG